MVTTEKVANIGLKPPRFCASFQKQHQADVKFLVYLTLGTI